MSDTVVEHIIVDGIDSDFVTLHKTNSGFYTTDDGYTFPDFYEYTIKNSSNQIIHVSFDVFEYDVMKDRRLWNVGMSVYSKRKVGYEFGKQTGRSGPESLIIAKKILKYHINHFYEITDGGKKEDILFIWGDDKRRFNIYKKYLSELGFTETKMVTKYWNSGKCLMKKIN